MTSSISSQTMGPGESSQTASVEPVVAVILAAGLGKRMGSDLPKVLLTLKGKPLVRWVVEAAQQAGVGRIVVVIGHKGEMIEESLADLPLEYVWQHDRLGTGHAVLQTESLLRSHKGSIVVLAGDVPLIRPGTIKSLAKERWSSDAAAVVLTADVDDPKGYGRVVRLPDGRVDRIVEDRDADDNIKRIREINTSTYCFLPGPLFDTLHRVGRSNAQGEYYLTDAVILLRNNGLSVVVHKVNDPLEVSGINSSEQLQALERLV